MSAKYGKITFANDYNKSFAEFKQDFADNHVFLNIPSDKREAEFKKAYAIATAHLNKKDNPDGKLSGPIKESEKANTKETI